MSAPMTRHDGVVAAAVVGTGIAAAWLLPGAAPGLGIPLVALAITAVLVVADPRDITRIDIGYGGLAFLLTCTAVVRSAEWIVALCVLVAMGLAVVAVTRATSWKGVIAAPLAVVARFVHVPVLVIRPAARLFLDRDMTKVGPVARGTAVAVFAVVVFGTLFATADAAFARLAHDLLVPRWDVELLPARIAVAGVVTLLAGALVLAKPKFAAEWLGERASWDAFFSSPAETSRKASVAEWAIPVVALDVLFASFVAVQISVLFGGRHHVEVTEGLTYAEYARQGFFQLLAVAALVLVVIAAVVALGRSDEARERSIMRWTLGALGVLTLVVLASALVRLELYEETFGFTRLRLAVHATIYWLAGIFVLVMAAGAAWRARWLPNTVVAYTAVALIAFVAINPDAMIARENLRRFEESGRIDIAYLATLSDDAVPVLLELPEPERQCFLWLSFDGVPRSEPWNGFNLARERAWQAISGVNLPNDGSACN